ncbi:PAS domain S-box protein [Methylomarinum sp. Ch1-1]|uniref:PAS domain S-box protein n=1 Tax=Methylomarinum roseum TaxID=3067653 RepID=A0AAU7NTJ5_9GAMM|nr:PAS domain S-box protein [Methylomarinum sp. Ch1-1]MDP4519672.1 PAS domain S-box protein [Methylomarinum sp. Ch1-1]
MDKTDSLLSKSELTARLQAELEAAQERERASQKTRRALLAMLEDLEETQVEVEQARHELQSAMDAVQDPIFMHDRDYRIMRANRAYAERTGLDVQQIIGKPYWQLFPKLDAPPLCCIETIEQKQMHEEELNLLNGETFLTRYYPILDHHNHYLYSLHMMQNVSERRRAEQEQRTLSEAFRQASEAMLVLDDEGKVRHINPAFQRLFGYDEIEISSQSISLLTAPEREATIQPPAVLEQLRKHGLWQGEVLRRAKDGAVIPVLLNASAIRNHRDEITGFINLYLDLRQIKQAESSLRESEEQFRAMSSAAQDAMLMLDDDSLIVFWNEAATRIFGYQGDEVIGQNVHLLLAPEHYHAAYRAGWPDFAKNGRGAAIGQVLELEALHKSGHTINIELSVAPVQIKQRWHAVGILRDISERKLAERKLRNVLRAHRTLSACNTLLVHSSGEQKLMSDMCRAIVELVQ